MVYSDKDIGIELWLWLFSSATFRKQVPSKKFLLRGLDKQKVTQRDRETILLLLLSLGIKPEPTT